MNFAEYKYYIIMYRKFKQRWSSISISTKKKCMCL